MDDVQEVFVAANSIVSYSNELEVQIEKFRDVYFNWAPKRCETISLIRSLGEKINKHHKNCNIANAVGGSVAIAGGSMVATGAVMAPFTGGASLTLTGLGVVVGGIGATVGGGVFVTDRVLQQKNKKLAIEILKSDKELTEELVRIASRIQQLTDNIETAAAFITQYHQAQQQAYCLYSNAENGAALVSAIPLADILDNLLYILPKVLDTQLIRIYMPKLNLRTISRALTWLNKLFRNTQFTQSFKNIIMEGGSTIAVGAVILVTGIAIAFEIVHFVVTMVDMSRGSKTETASKLFSAADTLAEEATKAERLFEALIDLQ